MPAERADPLEGDRALPSLALDLLNADESQRVAEYIMGAFYSPEARAKNQRVPKMAFERRETTSGIHRHLGQLRRCGAGRHWSEISARRSQLPAPARLFQIQRTTRDGPSGMENPARRVAGVRDAASLSGTRGALRPTADERANFHPSATADGRPAGEGETGRIFRALAQARRRDRHVERSGNVSRLRRRTGRRGFVRQMFQAVIKQNPAVYGPEF